jgi:hypothetical protein
MTKNLLKKLSLTFAGVTFASGLVGAHKLAQIVGESYDLKTSVDAPRVLTTSEHYQIIGSEAGIVSGGLGMSICAILGRKRKYDVPRENRGSNDQMLSYHSN